MKKKILLPVIALLGMSSVSLKAQETVGESITILSIKDDSTEIVEAFKETESEHFADPKAPRFLLYDQKRKVAFGIGGNVRLRTAYDFDGSPSSKDAFIPYSIPTGGGNMDRSKFDMNVAHSTLFFKLLGDNDKLGQYQVYVSGAFATDNTFKLEDAYVKVLGFTIGRTWSTFNDLAAVPPTIDWQGPNGAAEMRTEQIRYTRGITDQLSFGAAVELSQSTGRYGQPINDLKQSQRLPDVPVYLQYAFGANNGSHVRLAGVMRNMNYGRDFTNEEGTVINAKTKYLTAYGVQLSSKVNINPMFTLYGQVNYGNGIAQYINDLSGNGLSLVGDKNDKGKMKAPKAVGWFVQGQVNFTPSLYATAGYSQARIMSKQDKFDLQDTDYSYGQYMVGNVFYNLTSDLQLGLEYLYGNRVDFNKDKGHANRIQALVQFNF